MEKKNLNELLSWFENLIAKETYSSHCEDGSLQETTQ